MIEELEDFVDQMTAKYYEIDEDLTKEEAKEMMVEDIVQYLKHKYLY